MNHFLQRYIKECKAPTLSPPGPPSQLIQAVQDLKIVCSGYLATAKSIDVFFKLLHILELDKLCSYRENFWKNYLSAGFVTQSWLILAPRAAAIAVEQLGVKEHQFAKLDKNHRIDEKHAVLLMRLDSLVVAEWSHVGKCRFWYQGNVHAPALFKLSYRKEEIADYPDYIQQHYFSGKGLWQKDAATWMSAKAQIPVLV